jgi:hypothetical protein
MPFRGADDFSTWLAYRRLDAARGLRSRLYRVTHGRRRFTFAGKQHRYFFHPYNWAFQNERSVEVPIVSSVLVGRPRARTLELGNVLAHYGHSGHFVVDKYEIAHNVINEDIVDFAPQEKFDLVVSISTIEHVGWDEEPRDAGKAEVACERLVSLLRPGGELRITWPLGANPGLDRALRAGTLPFQSVGFMRRETEDNRWRESTLEELEGVEYGSPFQWGNAIAVATHHA